MGAQNMPAAEVDISGDLVRILLRAQHPDLAELDLRLVTKGWDNALYRLGDELTVRLPRRQMAADLVLREATWLPQLAPHLPLPVPAPVRVGRPTAEFPWSWTIVPWFEGEPVGASTFVDPARAATRLGEFLAALHRPAPEDAPLNPFRGGPLADRARHTIPRIEALAADIDVEVVTSGWRNTASVTPWEGPPMWIHGDLHPLNMVERDGELTAIIDFGDITAGDPATDLLVAWYLFDEPHRAILRAAAESAVRPIDDDMWERGRGWAISHSLAVLANGADHPTLSALGRRALLAATT